MITGVKNSEKKRIRILRTSNACFHIFSYTMRANLLVERDVSDEAKAFLDYVAGKRGMFS